MLLKKMCMQLKQMQLLNKLKQMQLLKLISSSLLPAICASSMSSRRHEMSSNTRYQLRQMREVFSD